MQRWGAYLAQSLVFLLLLAGISWWLHQQKKRRTELLNPGQFKNISSHRLDLQTTLYLIEVEGAKILLARCHQTIQQLDLKTMAISQPSLEKEPELEPVLEPVLEPRPSEKEVAAQGSYHVAR